MDWMGGSCRNKPVGGPHREAGNKFTDWNRKAPESEDSEGGGGELICHLEG